MKQSKLFNIVKQIMLGAKLQKKKYFKKQYFNNFVKN